MSTHFIQVRDTNGKVHTVTTTDTSGKSTSELVGIAANILSISASILTLVTHGRK